MFLGTGHTWFKTKKQGQKKLLNVAIFKRVWKTLVHSEGFSHIHFFEDKFS